MVTPPSKNNDSVIIARRIGLAMIVSLELHHRVTKARTALSEIIDCY